MGESCDGRAASRVDRFRGPLRAILGTNRETHVSQERYLDTLLERGWRHVLERRRAARFSTGTGGVFLERGMGNTLLERTSATFSGDYSRHVLGRGLAARSRERTRGTFSGDDSRHASR